MKLKNEFAPIREWATEKGILSKGDVKTQYVKLQEEAGELAKAIMKEDEEEFIDAIGDCVVVLTNLAELGSKHFNKSFSIEDCINSAYEVIKNRTGKMRDGTFVKDDETNLALNKPIVKAILHENGYYNLPCKHREINLFLHTKNIEINGRIFTSKDRLSTYATPSLTEGGVAYIYPSKLNKIK